MDAAVERNVELLAVTDHNTIDGFERACKRASETGIRLLSGVEIDARFGDSKHHFLAFGFDPKDVALRTLLARNFATYAQSFELLLNHFGDFGYRVDRTVLESGLAERYPTHPSPVLNLWYAREVLISAGIFPDRDTYTGVVAEIRAAHAGEDLLRMGTLEETIDVVHSAGGLLLLAHVSEYREGDPDGQQKLIRGVMAAGVDGFELHHVRNSIDSGFEALKRLANELQCPTSGGSDCHNADARGPGSIGSLQIPDWVAEKLLDALDRSQ